MLLHYKTIINPEDRRELYGEKTYFLIHTKANDAWSPLKVDYCCDEMKSAVTGKVLYSQEVGSSKDENFTFGLFLREEGEDGTNAWYYHVLKFCPFCGEMIQYVEDYQARLQRRKVHIPAKKTKARDEFRDFEVKINA